DLAFMVYTNGTLITEKTADAKVEAGNLSPAISLEGWRERTDARRGSGVFDRIMKVMDYLRERGVIFGVSITVTRYNVEEVTSDEFIDFLIDKGAVYGWTFHYIPVGRNPNLDLLVTPEQRAYLAERIPYIRTHKPIQIADFWNDGELTHGCIAGGRMYFHIAASGNVEPCAFAHFAADNIKGKSLLEVLKNPVFAAFQKRQPFSDNFLRPCPIIDVPEALREIVAESGAKPTHPGAESVLTGTIAAYLDRRSEEWGRVADGIWANRHPERKAAQSH
ncbi:MAG: radical SAM protein, partial [Firmicutes bacterium]|nr:radical SAM protein [Bacillota bacterium]